MALTIASATAQAMGAALIPAEMRILTIPAEPRTVEVS